MRTVLWLVALLVPLVKGALFNKQGGLFSRPPGVVKVPSPSASVSIIDAADQCAPTPSSQCDQNAPFRTVDGSCNNLVFPMWGQAGTALSRIAPARYQDGVNAPRKARSGGELPSPRSIVIQAFSFVENVDNFNTLALMSIGQLVSHDASLIGASADPSETCCIQQGPNCINIAVSPTDPFYGQFNVTCLPVTRAPTTASIGCSLKPEYTMTGVSHFIDASFVYGSSEKQMANLRENSGGRLKQDVISGQSYPPHNSRSGVCFGKNFCMDTGDGRANQNPPLGALQVIFFREHNRLAAELAKLNTNWDDERLYQESRKILIAEWQIIVYRDWLPYIVGPETVKVENLFPDLHQMRDDYDEFFNPSTTNDFTSAAFRVFHSQIPDAYCAKDGTDRATGCPFGAKKFSRSFENPDILATQGGFRSVLLGLDRQNVDKTDDTFTIEVAGKLFSRGQPWGHDLIATDILRGRDVGLPPYNEYRSLCGLRPARKWAHFADTFTPKELKKLRSIYESPEDVDLYVAGTLERKFARAIVGPIFECIIVDQFKRWMKGDRYFVDFKGFPHSFTPEQAKALADTSLARLFCDNGEGIKDIPKDVFLLESDRVPCDTIPRVNLTPWKEETKSVLKRIIRKALSYIFDYDHTPF